MTNIIVENVRTTIQCCDKWDKMKKKYSQEETTKGVTCSATTSWVWFNRMKQILEGVTKADGTPNGLDQGYAHAGSFQALNIKEDLLDDDIGPSQGGSVLP